MPVVYKLPPAHRRKILRMRALVDAASAGSARPGEPRPTSDALMRARAYLATHASCEAYLAAQTSGTALPERPRCGQAPGRRSTPAPSPPMSPEQGAASSRTRRCPTCKQQKSAWSFDDELGTCIKCKYSGPVSEEPPAKRKRPSPTSGSKGRAERVSSKVRKCPVCVTNVTVTLDKNEWVIESHHKGNIEDNPECRASGTVAYRERRDALDRRVPGSFEGGKRR